MNIRLLTRAQCVSRCEEINARMEELNDQDDISRDDAAEFRELADSFDEINQHRERLERKQALTDGLRTTEGGSVGTHSANGGCISGLGGSDGRRIDFGARMASRAAEKILPSGGERALAASGAVVIDQGFAPDPVALGRPANSLLSVLPTLSHPSAEFSYLRQTVRTNNAAIVAAGAVKPTSVFTVIRIEDSLDVVAHLSEGVPRHWLMDNSSLQQFLNAELLFGLQNAVEATVMTTINAATPGTQAFATSVLATLRKSLTQLEVLGLEPAFILLTPADWEGVELALSTTNSIEHMSLPYDAAARRLFGTPVVVSNAQAAGVSHTVAKGAVALDTDNRGVEILWSENSNADDFSKNLVRARCEGRYAASVYRPAGVIVGDLTA